MVMSFYRKKPPVVLAAFQLYHLILLHYSRRFSTSVDVTCFSCLFSSMLIKK